MGFYKFETLIVFGIALLIVIKEIKEVKEDQLPIRLAWPVVIPCAVFAFIVSSIIGIAGEIIVQDSAQTEVVEDYEYPIFALQDNVMYLGRFQENGNIKYAYMYQAPDGGQRLGSIWASDASIFEDGQQKIVVMKRQFKNPFIRKHFKAPSLNSLFGSSSSPSYQVHVPKGTIKDEFNVDLK